MAQNQDLKKPYFAFPSFKLTQSSLFQIFHETTSSGKRILQDSKGFLFGTGSDLKVLSFEQKQGLTDDYESIELMLGGQPLPGDYPHGRRLCLPPSLWRKLHSVFFYNQCTLGKTAAVMGGHWNFCSSGNSLDLKFWNLILIGKCASGRTRMMY